MTHDLSRNAVKIYLNIWGTNLRRKRQSPTFVWAHQRDEIEIYAAIQCYSNNQSVQLNLVSVTILSNRPSCNVSRVRYHEVCSKRKGEAPVSISPQTQMCSFCHFTKSDTFQVQNTLDSVSWRQLCLIKRDRQIYLTEETKHLQCGESEFMMKITTEQRQDFRVGKLRDV